MSADRAWCPCGHEMEHVRPGKFQKAGCCETVDILQARIDELENELLVIKQALIDIVFSEQP